MDLNFQFSLKSMDSAWELWWRDWNDEELSEAQHEFVFLAFEAERFNHRKKFWPTASQVLDFIEERKATGEIT
jgi:hypothetical protein